IFQDLAVGRSRNAVQALMDVRPDYANLLAEDRTMQRVLPKDVRIGDLILVKPGEKIPLDGEVVEGSSFLDTAVLTGESVPKRVSEGEQVLAGSVNTAAVLILRVNKPYSESAVVRILDLLENAAARKAPAEKFITRFSRYYTPAVVLAAAGIAFGPPLFTGAALTVWVSRALTLLVISCPCALVISVPLSYFGGIGSMSRRGILVKGANYLDSLSKLDTVVF
ncbi:MAG TPA: HAD-IC family P-type ATPase, partial [Desulfobacteria bacterium]|nr:HAD-IC family P-type ATPase [Desulfobacteria bacterium]